MNELNIKNLTLENICNMYNSKVKIFSTGSCSVNKEGKYFVLMEYKNHHKYLEKNFTNTTANRCIILGLIDAIMLLKKPCSIILITSTPIGLKNLHKSPNKDLLKKLLKLIEDKDCKYESIAVEGKGYELNKYIIKNNPL
jgi:ribonuclease HI